MSYDCTENLIKMKLLGEISVHDTCKITFKDLIDSETYKLAAKESTYKVNEDAWRFGFEDLRDNINQQNSNALDLLTRKELLEVCVEHRKKMPLIKLSNTEEERRLYSLTEKSENIKTDLQLYTEFIKVFPLLKRKDHEIDTKFMYLIPNIDFVI